MNTRSRTKRYLENLQSKPVPSSSSSSSSSSSCSPSSSANSNEKQSRARRKTIGEILADAQVHMSNVHCGEDDMERKTVHNDLDYCDCRRCSIEIPSKNSSSSNSNSPRKEPTEMEMENMSLTVQCDHCHCQNGDCLNCGIELTTNGSDSDSDNSLHNGATEMEMENVSLTGQSNHSARLAERNTDLSVSVTTQTEELGGTEAKKNFWSRLDAYYSLKLIVYFLFAAGWLAFVMQLPGISENILQAAKRVSRATQVFSGNLENTMHWVSNITGAVKSFSNRLP